MIATELEPTELLVVLAPALWYGGWMLYWDSGALWYASGSAARQASYALRAAEAGAPCLLEKAMQAMWRDGEIIHPTAEQWRAFWREAARCQVWRWRPQYYALAFDGVSWAVHLGHGGRRVISRGDNAFPGGRGADYSRSFTRFLAAVRALAGGSSSEAGRGRGRGPGLRWVEGGTLQRCRPPAAPEAANEAIPAGLGTGD